MPQTRQDGEGILLVVDVQKEEFKNKKNKKQQHSTIGNIKVGEKRLLVLVTCCYWALWFSAYYHHD